MTKPTPLPITLVPGMTVVSVEEPPAAIVGITMSYCIYRGTNTGNLIVAPWKEVAVANVCPARQLLPADITENDHRDASAVVLRELLALKEYGLSAKQNDALEELVAELFPPITVHS